MGKAGKGKKRRKSDDARAEIEREKKLMQEKLDRLGLNYQELEVPPDTVEQKDVAKSILSTIRSLIPYTQEYYEAKAAIEELNDLLKIRVEKSIAKELVVKAKTGKHDEALEEMLAETNNDLFYFNKLKYKQEQEGKWKYEGPIEDPFKYLSRGHNRLRKAFTKPFALLDDNVIKKLEVHGRTLSTKGNILQEEKTNHCAWRGKHPNSEEDLKCVNSRACFYFRKIMNKRGIEEPEYIAFCHYHALSCLGNHEQYPPRIVIPNSEGLCNECYLHKIKHPAPQLTMEAAPGVVAVNLIQLEDNQADNTTFQELKELQEDFEQEERPKAEYNPAIARTYSSVTVNTAPTNEGEGDDAELTDDSICCWRPNADESLTYMRGYICKNKVFRNPKTKTLRRTCAMHMKQCYFNHESGGGLIEIPNTLGLCMMHHIAVVGKPPKRKTFPYPGMERKLREKGWLVKAAHWAAPSWPPMPAIRVNKKKYVAPEKPEGYLNVLRETARLMTFNRTKKLYGKLAATIIQKNFRGYRLRGLHKKEWYKKRIPLRREAIVRIQAIMRGCLGRKRVQELKWRFFRCALNVQRIFRGWIIRCLVRKHLAAMRIQRAFRQSTRKKFFRTVMAVISVHNILKKREVAAKLLQAAVRGYFARKRIRKYKRKLYFKFNSAAILITRLFMKLKRAKLVIQARDVVNWRYLVARKLAKLLIDLYSHWKHNQHIQRIIMRAAPLIQRQFRGYVGRIRSKRLKHLKNCLLEWLNPQFAVDFLKAALSQMLYQNPTQIATNVPLTVLCPNKEEFIAPFVPTHVKNKIEIDYLTFSECLSKWYESIHAPLLGGEFDALYRRFKNPLDGKIDVLTIDKFISRHPLPCRLHARRICADCIFLRECNFGRCQCDLFKKDDESGKFCIDCLHSSIHHAIYPIAAKATYKTGDQMQMLEILGYEFKIDLQLPKNVTGLDSPSVITAITKRRKLKASKDSYHFDSPNSNLLLATKLNKQNRAVAFCRECSPKVKQKSIESSLLKSISHSKILGEGIAEVKPYWGQKDTVFHINDDNNVLNIHACSVDPDMNLTMEAFWSRAAKNPNKSVRDYNDGFEHSVPVPIVSEGELQYSLEGPTIYVAILKRIVELDEINKSNIHMDNGDFLRLVVDHIQIFERHWRKLVIDIRTGTLNKNVKVTDYVRSVYLSTSMPRPNLASRLDKVFRDLGFHMKVLGKDIQITGYATKKIVITDRKRRPSLPQEVLGERGSTMQKNVESFIRNSTSSSNELSPLKTNESAEKSPTSMTQFTGRRFSALKRWDSTPADNLIDIAEPHTTLSSTGKKEKEVTFAFPHDNKKTTKTKTTLTAEEAIVKATMTGSLAANELKNKLQERDERGASQRSRGLQRRGSDTDIYRPSTNDELQEITHKLHTDPRIHYHELVQVADRYICPFPACGISFSSRQAAFEHLKIHEQRKRLFASTPQSDSHLNFYWPKDAPWKSSAEYTKRCLPPGTICCPEKGCQEVFMSHHRLAYHIRHVHRETAKVSILQSFFTFSGDSRGTPPLPAPSYAPVDFCVLHLNLTHHCKHCLEYINSDRVPKQPFLFYDLVKVNFSMRDGTGGIAKFNRIIIDKGIYYQDDDGKGSSAKMGIPVAFMKDSAKDGWMAVRRFVTINDAQNLKMKIPRDPDLAHELLELYDKSVPPVWIKIAHVKGTFYVLQSTKFEFGHRLRLGEIPKENVFFVKPGSFEVIDVKTPSVAAEKTSEEKENWTHTPAVKANNSIKLPKIKSVNKRLSATK